MIETLFQQQKEWVTQKPLPPLLAIAKQAGMSEQAFNECLQDKKLIDGLEDVRQRGMKVGVQSTPSFFINGKPAPRRLHDRGFREGDRPLYQGLTSVFWDFHRLRAAPARRPPAGAGSI